MLQRSATIFRKTVAFPPESRSKQNKLPKAEWVEVEGAAALALRRSPRSDSPLGPSPRPALPTCRMDGVCLRQENLVNLKTNLMRSLSKILKTLQQGTISISSITSDLRPRVESMKWSATKPFRTWKRLG